ncbi:MAG: L-threonylcarbamoyladenylate synthase [Alphaproteobacteria bacterium]|nr:L-threonylcarbamoyladenylate synthase [Alphaproteobacteria bacterium]
MTIIKPATQESVKEAARLLQAGALVAFPTETVYGLGADATNARAVASIYEVKGRPQFNPLIIHIADSQALERHVHVHEQALKLAALFWPGPLTMVLPRKTDTPIALLAGAGLSTLAMRCPDHETALQLLSQAKLPIAAPSANASGTLSPTCAQDVYDSLGSKLEMILDAGKCKVGLESTILDLTSAQPILLRPGAITQEELETHLGPIQTELNSETPKSPGQLTNHYAPNLPVRLNATSAAQDEAFLLFGDAPPYQGGAKRLNLSETGDLKEAAANLFSMLRLLDNPTLKAIAITPIPSQGLGTAINDRLTRAAAPRKP